MSQEIDGGYQLAIQSMREQTLRNALPGDQIAPTTVIAPIIEEDYQHEGSDDDEGERMTGSTSINGISPAKMNFGNFGSFAGEPQPINTQRSVA